MSEQMTIEDATTTLYARLKMPRKKARVAGKSPNTQISLEPLQGSIALDDDAIARLRKVCKSADAA